MCNTFRQFRKVSKRTDPFRTRNKPKAPQRTYFLSSSFQVFFLYSLTHCFPLFLYSVFVLLLISCTRCTIHCTIINRYFLLNLIFLMKFLPSMNSKSKVHTRCVHQNLQSCNSVTAFTQTQGLHFQRTYRVNVLYKVDCMAQYICRKFIS